MEVFKTNEYFDGKVKSLSFNSVEGPATIGVMAPGDYEFTTSSRENMRIVSGSAVVKVGGDDRWTRYETGETFGVAANQKFLIRVPTEMAYLCVYS